MMKKIPLTIGNQIFSLKCGIGFGTGRKYLPFWVMVSVSDLTQNSGFGRTLIRGLLLELPFKILCFCSSFDSDVCFRNHVLFNRDIELSALFE